MKRIGFSGVPGSGKTSTARALSAFCRKETGFRNIELVSEYARRYISKYGSIETLMDQYFILQRQLDWENKVGKEVDLVITDSPISINLLYCIFLKKNTRKDTMLFNEILTQINSLNCPNRYDIIFHLPPKIEPVEDGIRPKIHFDDVWRKESDLMLNLIHKMFPPKRLVIIESESMNDRIKECLSYMEDLHIPIDPIIE